MTFGEKIQFLRKQKGFTQEQLASHLSVSRQAVLEQYKSIRQVVLMTDDTEKTVRFYQKME